LLFALAAFPLGIVFVSIFTISYLALYWFCSHLAAFGAIIGKQSKKELRILFLLAIFFAWCGVSIFTYYRGTFEILPLVAMFLLWVLVSIENIIDRGTSSFYVPFTIVLVCAFSFFLGHVSGGRFLQNSHIEHFISTKTGEVLLARVIRAGERGVVFYDVKKAQVGYRKWDDISEITGNSRFGSLFYSYFH
jgi:hypothetical protein